MVIFVLLFIAVFFKRTIFLILTSPLVYFVSKNKKKHDCLVPQSKRNLQGKRISAKLRKCVGGYCNSMYRLFIYKLSDYPSLKLRKLLYSRICLMKIGKGVTIYKGLELRAPYRITIGSNTVIGDNAILDGRNGLVIGSNVNFSSSVSVWTEQHDYRDPLFGCTSNKLPIVICDKAWLGPNTIILPEVRIGEGAVVAANAVVTKDVESYVVVGGVPAKKINVRPNNLVYTLREDYVHFI